MLDSGFVAAVIGDVVSSREAADRAALHARLQDVLADANVQYKPCTPFRITVGDEYQGCFGDVGSAVRATLWLTLNLAPEVHVRHGIGWGAVGVLSKRPRVEDGPAWWAARSAIDQVRALAARAAYRGMRTMYEAAAPEAGSRASGPDAAAVNAALLLRDELVAGLSEESVILVRGLLDGRTQLDLAGELGISASAVSQRVRRDGLAVLVRADELLGKVA